MDPVESTFALPIAGPVKKKYGFFVETSPGFVGAALSPVSQTRRI